MENRKVLIGIILLAALTRLLPHPPNFTPIAALALFSGANFNKKWALIISLSAMFLSDLVLGFHSTMPYVYFSFILIVLIGSLLNKRNNFKKLLLASFASSILFFVITNFGVWTSMNMYSKNITGLIQSYLMGIPFFKNTVMGDLFYSFSLFYSYEYLIILSSKLQKSKIKS